MSGEGFLSGAAEGGVGMNDERAWLLAHLWKKHSLAGELARNHPEQAELMGDRRRQLHVLIGEIENGLHLPSAEQMAAMVEAQSAQEAGWPGRR